MSTTIRKNNLFLRHVALPSDHGSWVFLLSPLLIGLFAGNSWSIAAIFLVITSLAAFLLRQPVTFIVKVYSGRRNRRDLSAAWFWIGIYGLRLRPLNMTAYCMRAVKELPRESGPCLPLRVLMRWNLSRETGYYAIM